MKTNVLQANKALMAIFAMLLPLVASAQTKVEIDGIWYNLVSKIKQAEVTYKGSSYDEYSDEYSGSITIPATVTYNSKTYSVTNIGENAFYRCSSLTDITIPEGVTSIGDGAFYYCTSLIDITIPESVTSIGDGAFYYCTSLNAVHINDIAAWCSIKFSSSSSNPLSYSDNLYLNGELVTDLTLPESVTSIGSYVFSYFRSLTSITLPESVTSIGDGAFGYCRSLIAINIPEGVTSIGDGTFYYCTSLTSITLPKSVTSIGVGAFGYCTSLNAINIPEGVTSIGEDAFYYCRSLTAIELPKKLKDIGSQAFAYCDELLDVYSYSKNVPSTYTDAFYGSLPEYMTLHVPANALYAYKTTEPWSSFGNFDTFEIIIENITLNQSIATLLEGGTLTLNATVTPDDATNKSITWSCSNTAVATVDAKGKVTAITPGTATITAMANDGSEVNASCKVTVEKKVVVVESIILSQTAVTLTEGRTLTLTAMVTPNDTTDPSITWSSSNTAIATIDIKGKVTAIAPGTTTITAMANDGSGVKASCEVTVVAAEYAIIYYVDSEEYYRETLARGTAIVPIEVPEKKGHTFSGWSEIPETMPAKDVIISGVFTINKYLITFKIGEKVIYSESLPYGAEITAPEAPEKEGHTFAGWGEVPATMPAKDITYEGSYTVNSYTVTFKIGEEVIYSETLPYGAEITAPEAPEKEGHTFRGWGEVAETVPAKDITYEGSYTVNSYTVTFKIGEEVIYSESLPYGAEITAPEAPEKEGHTFSGWGEIPATMPASDVTIKATFTINKYLVTFEVDGIVVSSKSLEYGTAITAPTMPEREGYTFSGWSNIDATVPANDVTYHATYTPNTYKVYYFVGATLVHIAEVTYGEAIPEYTYKPTTEGDVFMGWIGEAYDTMPAHDVTYTANIVNGIENSEINTQNSAVIYDLTGRKVLDTENLKGGIYIKDGKKVVIK